MIDFDRVSELAMCYVLLTEEILLIFCFQKIKYTVWKKIHMQSAWCSPRISVSHWRTFTKNFFFFSTVWPFVVVSGRKGSICQTAPTLTIPESSSLIYFKQITKLLIILREILQYNKQRRKLNLDLRLRILQLEGKELFPNQKQRLFTTCHPKVKHPQTNRMDSMAVYKWLINLLKWSYLLVLQDHHRGVQETGKTCPCSLRPTYKL